MRKLGPVTVLISTLAIFSLSRATEARKGGQQPAKSAKTSLNFQKAWKHLLVLQRRVNKLPRRSEPADDLDLTLLQLEQELNDISKLAVRSGYDELLAFSLEVEGRLLGAAGQPEEEYKKYAEAARVCDKGACPLRRRRVLDLAARLYEKQGKIEKAFDLFAAINSESSAGLPADVRRYSRSADLVRVCRALRKKNAPGACYRIEKKTTGSATFPDFSKRREKGMLSKTAIAEVHREYLPLLQACLSAAAKRRTVQPGDNFELFWAITNQGRTDRFQCSPSDDEELSACFRRALEIFRYPRYAGERRTVTLPMTVNR
ncbi:MAG TPA: hypothetical protein VM425_10830 [Myxococcota bacterium]|nr:hypothetical protein [Myxococcota bacterium]